MKKEMSKNVTINPSTGTTMVPRSKAIGSDCQYATKSTATPLREKLKGLGEKMKANCSRGLNKIQDSRVHRFLMIALSEIDDIASAVSRGLWRLLIVGLLALIPLALFPELGEKFPVFFQVSEGIIAVFEWMWTALFGFIRIIAEIFTGDFGTASGIFQSIWNDFIGLFQQLWNWIQSIQF